MTLTYIASVEQLPANVAGISVRDYQDAQRYMKYYGVKEGYYLPGDYPMLYINADDLKRKGEP
jgi:hypothetical protein